MSFVSLTQLSKQNPTKIYLFTVGGCGEFGMNLTVYAYQGKSYIVDCGLAFAEPFEIGVDARIPDVEELEAILGAPPEAYFITHGHEDHIGALPYFLARWPAPVYIGPWARELVKEKLSQMRDDSTYVFHECLPGNIMKIGPITLHWVHVPHSIPHCSSLLIEAGEHRIFHTGDFKLQGFTPIEPDLDLDHLSRLRAKGPILAVVSDSTNAQAPGKCPSELTIIPSLKKVLESASGASFLTTFSSNLWRIKIIMQIATELNKKVLIFGAGMRRCLDIAVRLKLVGDEVRCLVDEEGSRRVERRDLVVIASGCQGEYKAGLKRLICNEVSFLNVREDDQVIFSSRVIPGNEKAIAKLMSLCHLNGAKVITAKEEPNIHVSGHAYSGDLTTINERLRPTFSIPVHGTFTQMKANQKLSLEETKIVEVVNGQITELSKDEAKVITLFDLNLCFLDSWSRQPMSFETMRARHKIGDSGLALVTGFISKQRFQIDFEAIGLPFKNEHDIESCEADLKSALQRLYTRLSQSPVPFNSDGFNEEARILIRRKLSEQFIKKPVVISKIFASKD